MYWGKFKQIDKETTDKFKQYQAPLECLRADYYRHLGNVLDCDDFIALEKLIYTLSKIIEVCPEPESKPRPARRVVSKKVADVKLEEEIFE